MEPLADLEVTTAAAAAAAAAAAVCLVALSRRCLVLAASYVSPSVSSRVFDVYIADSNHGTPCVPSRLLLCLVVPAVALSPSVSFCHLLSPLASFFVPGDVPPLQSKQKESRGCAVELFFLVFE